MKLPARVASERRDGSSAAPPPRGQHPIEIVVPREGQGARLDQFVTGALRGGEDAPSRAEVQRWILDARVTVDGDPGKPSDKLRAGAKVVVEPGPAARSAAEADAGVAFEVLYLDDEVVVVNKPAGLVVHPAKGHETGTLVNGLLGRGMFREEQEWGREPEREREREAERGSGRGREEHTRPGIVHRIDKGTSGILVVARTARARESLKAQLAAHTVLREYEALCVGSVETLRHATLHGRHPTDRIRFTSRVTTGKRAVTHVRVVERMGVRATHVVCSLETGRTHQIRVHLSETGTPILGDTLYGKPPRDPELRAIAETLGHQALHARLLGFVHPATGKPVRFEAPVPDDFAAALTALRRPGAE